ncbi:hypothetical protein [Spirochaeta dissipatitropha]
MRKNRVAVVLIVCMLTSMFSLSALAAQETESAYMFGDSPLLVDVGAFGAFGLYNWAGVLAEPELNLSADEQYVLSEFLGLLTLITSLRVGINAGAMYPVFSAGIMDIHAGGELSVGFGLGMDAALRAQGRFSLTPTDNDGNRGDSLYIQPFLGYFGVFPDIPGMMKEEILSGNTGTDGLDNASEDAAAGHYFDLGIRFGYLLKNGVGAYFDVEYPIGRMSPLRFTSGANFVIRL